MNTEMNGLTAQALARAILATRRLDALDVVVLDIVTGPEKSTLHVVDPQNNLRGALVKTIAAQGAAVRTYSADVEGCRVQWHVREDWDRRTSAQIPPDDDDELPPCIGERMRDAAFDIARNGADA